VAIVAALIRGDEPPHLLGVGVYRPPFGLLGVGKCASAGVVRSGLAGAGDSTAHRAGRNISNVLAWKNFGGISLCITLLIPCSVLSCSASSIVFSHIYKRSGLAQLAKMFQSFFGV
jgi:hypothetical protein